MRASTFRVRRASGRPDMWPKPGAAWGGGGVTLRIIRQGARGCCASGQRPAIVRSGRTSAKADDVDRPGDEWLVSSDGPQIGAFAQTQPARVRGIMEAGRGAPPLTKLNPARRNAIAERPRASAVNHNPAIIQLLVVLRVTTASGCGALLKQRERARQGVTDRNTRCEGGKPRVRPVPATQLIAKARHDAALDRWRRQLLRPNWGLCMRARLRNSHDLCVSLRVSSVAEPRMSFREVLESRFSAREAR